MTPLLERILERIRERTDPLASRLRETPGGWLLAIVATLAVGVVIGRVFSPGTAGPASPVIAAATPEVAPKAVRPTDFESLVEGESPFETSRQGEQKRLVALQNTLAAAIAEFDGVERAAVFIAPRPASTGFGPAAASRTASVHLSMESGHRLGPQQLEAIAKLVAGAETGLRPESVAIVDGSGPSTAVAAAFDREAAERVVCERLASLLPEGTDPVVSILAGPGGTSIDVAIAIPHAYFLAAHARSGEAGDSFEAFRASEAERLADSTRRSLESALGDEGGVRIAACRVDWTFLATPDVAGATVAGTGGWVRPLVVASLGIALAVVVAMAVAVPWWRTRQRTAAASSEAIVEAKPDEAGLEAVVRRDPAEAARAIDRWVRGGAA